MRRRIPGRKAVTIGSHVLSMTDAEVRRLEEMAEVAKKRKPKKPRDEDERRE